MIPYKALNLLQSIEEGATNAAALQTILTTTTAAGAEANAAGFGAFLNVRSNAKRMAANTVTMAAINGSEKAIQLVFANTTEHNFSIVQEIAKSSSAMSSISLVKDSLDAVIANDVAWSFFKASSSYETNIIKILATLTETLPSAYATVLEVVQNTTTMGALAGSEFAMKALIANEGAMEAAAATALAMADIVADPTALSIVANDDASMRIVANSSVALLKIDTDVLNTLVGIPSAILVLSTYDSAWDDLMNGYTALSANIYNLLTILSGLDSTAYANVAAIFANASAAESVASSKPAMVAVIHEIDTAALASIPSTMDVIVASTSLGNVLTSPIAMTLIIGSTPTMESLIVDGTAFPILLTSSAAKSAIFDSGTASGSLFSIMMGNADAKALLVAAAQSATITNDAAIGTFKPSGIAGNIIVFTGVMGSIVATTLSNTFRSADGSGSFTIGLPGTSLASGHTDILKPFTDMEWDIASIAATAAGNVTIIYAPF